MSAPIRVTILYNYHDYFGISLMMSFFRYFYGEKFREKNVGFVTRSKQMP